MKSINVELWCDELVRKFLFWATGYLNEDYKLQMTDVSSALRAALSMMLMPSSFSRRDYVLFKLGEDRKEEGAGVGLDKVVDVSWSWDFVCVRPQKIEMLSDYYSEDGFGGSNWMYFHITELRPSGEWTTTGDGDDFSFPNRNIRGIKVVQRGRVVCQTGDIKISDVCCSSLNPSARKRWKTLSEGRIGAQDLPRQFQWTGWRERNLGDRNLGGRPQWWGRSGVDVDLVEIAKRCLRGSGPCDTVGVIRSSVAGGEKRCEVRVKRRHVSDEGRTFIRHMLGNNGDGAER